MRRARSGRLATAFLLVVAAGCAGSPNPIRPDGLDDSFRVPDFLRPSLELIDSSPRMAPLLDRPTGEWIRLHVRGVEFDPVVPASVGAHCCDASGMVRWSGAWIPDVRDSEQVRLAAAILVNAVRRARGFAPTCGDRAADTLEAFDIGC